MGSEQPIPEGAEVRPNQRGVEIRKRERISPHAIRITLHVERDTRGPLLQLVPPNGRAIRLGVTRGPPPSSLVEATDPELRAKSEVRVQGRRFLYSVRLTRPVVALRILNRRTGRWTTRRLSSATRERDLRSLSLSGRGLSGERVRHVEAMGVSLLSGENDLDIVATDVNGDATLRSLRVVSSHRSRGKEVMR
ncbi:MAG: hypothetical protein AAF517_04930 [Planctomycetota bacterium]